MKKCPVCGSTNTRKFGVYSDQLRCDLCGTTDSAAKFPETTGREATPRAGVEIEVDSPPHYAKDLSGYRQFLDDHLGAGVSNAYHVNDEFSVVNHVPPPHVQDALRLIEDFFGKRDAKQWAFGGIQSRDADSLLANALRGEQLTGVICAPTMTLQDVHRLAAAFRLVAIPRVTLDKIHEISVKVCDGLGSSWAFSDESERTRCRDLVLSVLEELGLQ